jgi:hypothetical protein
MIGNVVTVHYNSNKSADKVGLFLVYSTNRDTPNPKNFNCFKITSKTTDLDQYSYKLLKSKNTFLKVDSFVQTNKLFTFDISSAIPIGSINKIDLITILNLKNKFDTNVNSEMLNQIIKGGY